MLPKTSQLSRTWLTDIAFITCLLLVFYTAWLGSYPFFTPDEGRYAEVAREMVATGDYITPKVNGVSFLDKPIFYYWLQAAAIKLLGVSEWAVRLFPALFGVLGCLMTYICGRQLFNRRAGLLAAFILGTSPLYFGAAHYANLDLEVAVLISCSLLCIITALQHPLRIRLYFLFGAYGFAGLAFLTKGLIGIAFPLIITTVWVACLGHWDLTKRAHLIKGFCLIAVIALPWYALAQRANPDFLHYFFVTQQMTRFLSKAEFNNKMPFWFYLPVILVGFLPWTLFLFQALIKHIRMVSRSHYQHAAESFLLLWVLIILVFFSVPRSKIITYILPIFPALALLTGHYLSARWEKSKLAVRAFTACLAISTGFLVFLVNYAGQLNTNSAKKLVTELKAQMKPGDEVIHYFKYYYDVPLYLGKTVTIVADWDAKQITKRDNWVRELSAGRDFDKANNWLINEYAFWQRYNSSKRVFVFLNKNYFAKFKAHGNPYFIIAKKNGIILLSNRKST